MRALVLYGEMDLHLGRLETPIRAAVLAAAAARDWWVMTWCKRARNSVYVHDILGTQCHVHRWGNINDSASHALEKINADVKWLKKGTRRDRKVEADGRKPADGMLVSIDGRAAVECERSVGTLFSSERTKAS